MTIQDRKSNLSAVLHGGSLNKLRNVEDLFERAQNTLLSKCRPLETIRTAGLASTVHDDFYVYALPSDFRGLIDLYPQDNRTNQDQANRVLARKFNLKKAIRDKEIVISGSEGAKIIKINWRSRQGKTLHTMNSVTDNGTWSTVGDASGLVANSIFKISGSASLEFDLTSSGDGIQNTDMDAIDMTDEDEVADVFVWAYFGSVTNLTSLSAKWGNDLTTAYWTSVAQTTQADGTALKAGWNLLKFPWSTATETGTVNPASIDSFRLTVAASGAIANIRVDNIVFSIGRNFDIEYYSKYCLKNSAGTWISKTTSDSDTVVLDNDSIQLLLMEDLKAAAQQLEGTDSAFDLTFSKEELETLYRKYNAQYPSMEQKAVSSYGGLPFRNRRR